MSLYLASTDADVLAALAHNADGRRQWKEDALAWAAARGADSFFPSHFAGRWTVVGLPIQPTGFGRWTKPDHRGRSAPFANNAAEQAALRALRFDQQPVPGVPESLDSVMDSDGRHYLMWPTPFVHDDTAWLCYSHQPAPGEVDKIGPQWTECLASAYHAAREAILAAETDDA